MREGGRVKMFSRRSWDLMFECFTLVCSHVCNKEGADAAEAQNFKLQARKLSKMQVSNTHMF